MSQNPHNGKHLVIQKGKAMCNKGTKLPNFRVTSHQKQYWNDANGSPDYLAVTEADLTFNPPIFPFGKCALKKYKPCSFSPAGKWKKTYGKTKIMGKKCLTEVSELRCVIGGKITVMQHGQQSEVTKNHVRKADPDAMTMVNPLCEFEQFQNAMEKENMGDYI